MLESLWLSNNLNNHVVDNQKFHKLCGFLESFQLFIVKNMLIMGENPTSHRRPTGNINMTGIELFDASQDGKGLRSKLKGAMGTFNYRIIRHVG